MTCHSSSMAVAQPNPPQGLANELWHGLQVSKSSFLSLSVATFFFLNNPIKSLSIGSPTFGDFKQVSFYLSLSVATFLK